MMTKKSTLKNISLCEIRRKRGKMFIPTEFLLGIGVIMLSLIATLLFIIGKIRGNYYEAKRLKEWYSDNYDKEIMAHHKDVEALKQQIRSSKKVSPGLRIKKRHLRVVE